MFFWSTWNFGVCAMTALELKSPGEAERIIATIFQSELDSGKTECLLSCQDDSAFDAGKWLQLGTIRLPPLSAISAAGEEINTLITTLIGRGAYEWLPPDIEAAKSSLSNILGTQEEGLDPVLGDISSIAIRAGLIRPAFDSGSLEDMPYRNPTTIVSDTSGVLQGGLDFVAKFLYPAARVKVPAIVNMELTNIADSFFALRRAEKKEKPDRRRRELVDHLKSQGGQRALLRMELQEDTEVERTFLLGDPLREAFAVDNGGEVKGLNIARPIRSYVDRLIVEAARHHQAQTGPGHVVRLLTSDQGLARMSLAEGIEPLYFSATKPDKLFGCCLTGRTLHPFSGQIHSVSLATFLWEMATAFGAAKLEGVTKKKNLLRARWVRTCLGSRTIR